MKLLVVLSVVTLVGSGLQGANQSQTEHLSIVIPSQTPPPVVTPVVQGHVGIIRSTHLAQWQFCQRIKPYAHAQNMSYFLWLEQEARRLSWIIERS